MDVDGGRRVFNRVGRGSSSSSDDGNSNSNSSKQQKVCFHWRQGKCTKFLCLFLHSELPAAGKGTGKRPQHGFGSEDYHRSGGGGSRRPGSYHFNNNWGRTQSQPPVSGNRIVVKKIDKLCNRWVQESCKFGGNCKYLHQWCTGDCFSLLTPLEGHQQIGCNTVRMR